MKITSAHAMAFVALVVSVGGGFAVAHNGDTDKVHFCISNTEEGNVRAVPPENTCRPGETPTDVRVQNAAYHTGDRGPTPYAARKGYQRVSKQLIVPAAGESFALAGKLVFSKRVSGARNGIVTCQLESTDNTRPDRIRIPVRRGTAVPMSFLNSGKTDGRHGTTAAVEISCRAPNSAFVISELKMTAFPLNTISKGIPIG